MNTYQLHKTALGRIVLLTRSSIMGMMRHFLIFQLIMAIVFFFAPFFISLLTHGLSATLAFRELARSYDSGELIAMYSISTWIYCLVWINKTVHDSKPTAFTQLPASTGEKLTMIVISVIGYMLITLIAVTLITLFFSWVTPHAYPYTTFSIGGVFRGLEEVLRDTELSNLLAAKAVFLFSIVMPVLVMLYFRNPLFGLCAIGLISLVLGGSVSYTMVSILSSYSPTYDIDKLLENVEQLKNIFTVITFIVDIALGYWIYHRLRTIQIK